MIILPFFFLLFPFYEQLIGRFSLVFGSLFASKYKKIKCKNKNVNFMYTFFSGFELLQTLILWAKTCLEWAEECPCRMCRRFFCFEFLNLSRCFSFSWESEAVILSEVLLGKKYCFLKINSSIDLFSFFFFFFFFEVCTKSKDDGCFKIEIKGINPLNASPTNGQTHFVGLALKRLNCCRGKISFYVTWYGNHLSLFFCVLLSYERVEVEITFTK